MAGANNPVDDNVIKRLDALSMLVDFMQQRLKQLEEDSTHMRVVLTKLEISVGSLNDYLQRQRKLEDNIVELNRQVAGYETKFMHLETSLARMEKLLWGVVLALVPAILTITWELVKNFFGK